MWAHLTRLQANTTPAERARRFNRLLLHGEVRRAVRFITEREEFAVHNPNARMDPDDPTSPLVMDVLRSKHPPPAPLPASRLPSFPTPPPTLPTLLFTPDVISTTATKLSGACGLNGVDGPTLKNWLLFHRTASAALRDSFQMLANWMANDLVPWASIRALKARRGLALNKFPGVRPIGIGNIEDRFLGKLVLGLTQSEATVAAGIANLSAGLPSGIEGGIHAAHQVWNSIQSNDDEGFFLADADNAFNRLNRLMMLFVVRHLWPSAALFIFNSHKHFCTVIFHDPIAGTATTLIIGEGVIQGDPLAMVSYCLAVTPLSH